MLMFDTLILFLSLSLGYVVCVLADKQQGNLKTLGYTIGISAVVLSLLYGVAASEAQCYAAKKMGRPSGPMPKHHRMVKR